VADSDQHRNPEKRPINWRAWGIAVFSLAVITAIVLVAVLRKDDYPHDLSSSDVKACELVDHAAVARAAGTTEFKKPAAPKVGTVNFNNPGDDSAVATKVDIHNLDQCTYYLNQASAHGDIPYLHISVLPDNPIRTDPIFAAGASHAVKGGVTYTTLPGVGSDAVLGTTSRGSLLSYEVTIRASGWDIDVDALLTKAQIIAVSKLLAAAPQLTAPPHAKATPK
jgi:hypothetical protein